MFPDKIWFYISSRVDNDNILPSEDEIYTKFQDYFDFMGYRNDVIAQQMEAYLSCSQIDGVKIEWEGKIEIVLPSAM